MEAQSRLYEFVRYYYALMETRRLEELFALTAERSYNISTCSQVNNTTEAQWFQQQANSVAYRNGQLENNRIAHDGPSVPHTHLMPQTSSTASNCYLPQHRMLAQSTNRQAAHDSQTAVATETAENAICLARPTGSNQENQLYCAASSIAAPLTQETNRPEVFKRPRLKRSSAPRKQKTPQQLKILEEVFQCNRSFPQREQRLELSQRTGLTEAQIRLWFQYKRNKLIRETKKL